MLQKFNVYVLQKVKWIWFNFKTNMLGFSGAVEAKVADMQEVRSTNPCKDGHL